MTRSYTLDGVYDSHNRPVSQAIATAYNADDPNNLVEVENQQLTNGACEFVALPDTVPIDVKVSWGKTNLWFYDVFSVTGASLEQAIEKMHDQGTDTALGTQAENLVMGGYKITGLGTPTAAADAATKSYVDLAAMGGVVIDIFKWVWLPAGEKLYGDLDTGEMQCRVSGEDAGTATLIHQGFKLDGGKLYVWEIT